MHQWISLNELYKQMESFFFEARILIKLQCVRYQWICLDEVYELMERFLQILESFFELTTIF